MKMRTALQLTLILGLALLTAAPAADERTASDPPPIGVIVRESTTPIRAVEGARVTILGAAGHELATALTDDTGTAYLRYIRGDEVPVYVLVEATDCYISGLRWEPRALQYYILVTGRSAM